MALNLSTLTNSATSSSILNEALTTADLLDPVPILKNLARGSNKGGDAKQTTALNQPRALPLDANGKGYCYLPVTTGNAPAVTFPTIGANDDFVLEMKVYIVNVDDFHVVSGSNNHRILIYSPSGVPSFQYRDGSNNNNAALSGSLSAGLSTLRFEKTGSTLVFKQNGAVKGTINNITAAPTFTHLSFNGQFSTSRLPLNGYIQTCTLSIGGTEQLNIDFTATNVRHGDTKFKCATGQVVTVNQSGNDPAKIIKRSVLRFDGVNNFLSGVFNQTITGSSIFMAYSVLGDGGVSGRLLGLNSTGANDNDAGGYFLSRDGSTTNLISRYNGGSNIVIHASAHDDAVGDVLLEANIKNGSQISKLNNANEANGTTTVSGDLSSEEFKISSFTSGSNNSSIDLEYLAVFPSLTTEQASSVRSFINNRNKIYLRHQADGYYFFDPQKATFTGNFTNFGGGNILDGYITGSDNGDTDVRSNLTLIQETQNDQPSTDGYTITFNDTAEHLEFKNGVSQNLSGWQVVGTSLGTFVYLVQGAVSELNLLGNLGNSFTRKLGDLYGIILLPDSASSADIESARRLLIDRGASDGAATGDFSSAWRQREDIVEFNTVNMSAVTNAYQGWYLCNAISEFRITDISNCSDFTSSWQGCSSLQSFPASAKLGTSAQNVNFTDAWRDSGLQSFPALDLSAGADLTRSWFYTPLVSFGAIDASNSTNFSNAWQGTAILRSFPAAAKLGTSAVNVNFTNAWRSSGLTSFSTPLTTTNRIVDGFNGSTLLTDFSADVFANWNPQNLASGVFHDTWKGCTSLTAQSVENILTSIDASGQHGTDDGTATGNPLGDSGIDIDYDGTTLSAATNSAVDSLKAKGWVIVVNGVTL